MQLGLHRLRCRGPQPFLQRCPVRHHVPIPRTLAGFTPSAAKVEDGKLTVRFEKARAEGALASR